MEIYSNGIHHNSLLDLQVAMVIKMGTGATKINGI